MRTSFQKEIKLFFIVSSIFLFSIGTKSAMGQTEIKAENDPTIITLMVVYTQAAEDWADENRGGINNIIAQGIELTNQALINSDLNVEIILVHSGKVNYEESGDNIEDLRRLRRDSDGYIDEIHELRDRYNADLVNFLYNDNLNSGRAYIPNGSLNPILGFSILDVQRVSDHDFAFPHEIAHNFGFNHSRNQDSETAPDDGGLFEYSTGWRWKGNDSKGYASIMTYPEGDRQPLLYSNPNVKYQGKPTGSYKGKYAPADNARTLREVKIYLAGYRGPAHEGDSLAVISLYESTNGVNWDDNTNWNTSAPLRKWQGINKLAWRIFSLSLSTNNLAGTLPPELGNLKEMRELFLMNNNISGSIPEEIWGLTSLRWLALDGNELSGTIAKDVENLTDLELLGLFGNNLSGHIPSEIGSLNKLETLDLGYNNLKGKIPAKIGNLKNLVNLFLSKNDLRGPIPTTFIQLNNLVDFWFKDTFLCIPSDQEFLDWLSNVQDVDGTGIMCEDVKPGGIALQIPEKNSTDQSLSPLLQWTQSENVENYHIQISKDDSFDEVVLDSSNVKNHELQLNNLESGTTFYWRVRGTNDYLDSEWTESWSFTTSEAAPPENIALSTLENTVELSWTPVDSDAVTAYLIFKGETTASMGLYETVDSSQSTFTDEPSQGSSFYAVSAEYGEGVQSNITEILSYYNSAQTISDFWQLIGVPVRGQELNPQNVDLFGFDRIYERDEIMLPGRGYWIRSDNTEELDVKGEGLIEAEVNLQSGWNLIGGIADVISASSIKDPSGILTEAPIYEYSGSSYSQASNLEPGKGYWIYASEEGMIELEHGEPQVVQEKQKSILANLHELHIRCGTALQRFWISEKQFGNDEKLSFLMPPKAPEPVLDIRTTDGYRIGTGNRFSIDLTAESFPVEITLQMNQEEAGDYAYRLVGIEEGNEVHHNLIASQAVQIEKDYEEIYLERVQKEELITEYSLFSNYPNPFNPSTNIRYQLPQQSHVLVEVFDITGRRVASLVDAMQRAGMYTVHFDGSNQASGVYFLRFRAEQFSDIQKLTLIK